MKIGTVVDGITYDVLVGSFLILIMVAMVNVWDYGRIMTFDDMGSGTKAGIVLLYRVDAVEIHSLNE